MVRRVVESALHALIHSTKRYKYCHAAAGGVGMAHNDNSFETPTKCRKRFDKRSLVAYRRRKAIKVQSVSPGFTNIRRSLLQAFQDCLRSPT